MMASLVKESLDMAHDGQDVTFEDTTILTDALQLSAAALSPCVTLLDSATAYVRTLVSRDGRVSARLIEQHQTAAHGLAWLATYVEALRQMHRWAHTLQTEGKFGEVEKLLLQIGFGEYLAQILGGIPISQSEILRLQDIVPSQQDIVKMQTPEIITLTRLGNSQTARSRLVILMQEQSANITTGACGLDDELEMIRE
jgi:(2S)-methylsuccinyl-CoA dehydrogenase